MTDRVTAPAGGEASDAIPSWQLEENAQRTAAYRKDLDTERFLAALNAHLDGFERGLPAAVEGHPLFLFFGVPRCGKTFFSQLMVQSLGLGSINNFVARFWRAPRVGLELAHILGLETGASEFNSDYGKTGALTDPHDFHYFWQHWLRVDHYPYDPGRARGDIDWTGLATALRRISGFWGRAGLIKAIDAVWFMRELVEVYPQVVFVYLERDPIDSALSLARGRLDNYGDLARWYGQAPLPDTYRALQALPWAEQIAGQLAALMAIFEEALATIDARHWLRIDYRDICLRHGHVLDLVRARAAALGTPIATVQRPTDDAIRYSRHDPTEPRYAELAAALEQVGVPLRLVREDS